MSLSLDRVPLMRAFTTRRHRADADGGRQSPLSRATSLRSGKPLLRTQISGPVALISTSNSTYINEDVFNAAQAEQPSSPSSSHSDEESDSSMLSLDTANTDASSIDISEATPTTPEPEPNHLSCYFKPAVDTATNSPGATPSLSRQASFEIVPAIPKRMPSHSKKAHENLHRKRSIQRFMSPPTSIRSSLDILDGAPRGAAEPRTDSPFGSELAQLDVVAEELATVVGDAQADADKTAMQTHDLAIFAASDYMDEINDLLREVLELEQPAWI